MAEDIVACSGCGKKFRIPDGSPPSGKFACTACGADVAWGAQAASSGGGSRSKAKGKAARGSKAAAGSASGGGSRGARRARGRRSRDEEPEDEGGGGRRGHLPKQKENKTVPIVVALMGGVLLIGALIVVLTGEKPDYSEQAANLTPPASTNGNGSGALSTDGSGEREKAPETPAETTTTAPVEPLVPVQPEAGGDDEEASGIGGAETAAQRERDYRYWFLRKDRDLFDPADPIEGTTPEEAARLTELASLATDFDSGSAGMKAEGELTDVGRKAVPFLMNQLGKAWTGSKWSDSNEQFTCSKVQQLARMICKANGPPSDLVVRFPPGPGVEPSHYERAAQMWMAWWKGEGQFIEQFKSFEDEE